MVTRNLLLLLLVILCGCATDSVYFRHHTDSYLHIDRGDGSGRVVCKGEKVNFDSDVLATASWIINDRRYPVPPRPHVVPAKFRHREWDRLWWSKSYCLFLDKTHAFYLLPRIEGEWQVEGYAEAQPEGFPLRPQMEEKLQKRTQPQGER